MTCQSLTRRTLAFFFRFNFRKIGLEIDGWGRCDDLGRLVGFLCHIDLLIVFIFAKTFQESYWDWSKGKSVRIFSHTILNQRSSEQVERKVAPIETQPNIDSFRWQQQVDYVPFWSPNDFCQNEMNRVALEKKEKKNSKEMEKLEQDSKRYGFHQL